MHPLVRAAAAVAVLSALGSFDTPKPPPSPIVAPPSTPPRASPGVPLNQPALCGPRTIPEGSVCLPLPDLGVELDGAEGAPASEPLSGAHPALEPGRGLETYDHIPRRPDRSPDLTAYQYPIGAPGEPVRVLSGYDLDLPGAAQRRTSHAVGHGAVDIAASRRDTVRVAELENQEGQAEVAFIGPLFGSTVVTNHLVREAGHLNHYVVLYGHLDGPREGLAPGEHLSRGAIVGYAGDSGSPGIVHLHLEIRKLRDGVDLAAIDLRGLLNNAVSIASDPRNVLIPTKR